MYNSNWNFKLCVVRLKKFYKISSCAVGTIIIAGNFQAMIDDVKLNMICSTCDYRVSRAHKYNEAKYTI